MKRLLFTLSLVLILCGYSYGQPTQGRLLFKDAGGVVAVPWEVIHNCTQTVNADGTISLDCGLGDITSVGNCATGACPGTTITWGDGVGPVVHTYSVTGTDPVVTATDGKFAITGTATADDLIVKAPWVDVRAYASLNAAYTAVTSTKTILISNEQTLTAAISGEIHLVFIKGGHIHLGNYSLTFANGSSLQAPENQQIFDYTGSGVVSFSSGSISNVYYKWWYSGSGTCHTAINNAIDALYKGNVLLNEGTIVNTGTINLNKDRINIIGAGKQISTIEYTPSGAGIALYAYKPGGTLTQNIIKGIGFNTDNTYNFTKIAIGTRNTSELKIEDIAIYPWAGNSASIGIQLGGRQLTSVYDISISADYPISIIQNLDRALFLDIDCDHLSIHNSYLAASVGSTISIETGVNLTNLVIDGTNAWIPTTYGVYWNDTTTIKTSANVSISNVRLEQTTNQTVYLFYLAHNYGLQNVTFDNIYGGLLSKGYYFRKLSNVTIKSSYYVNGVSNEALNVDATVSGLELINNFWQADTTASMTGQFLIAGVTTAIGPLPRSAIYSNSIYASAEFDRNVGIGTTAPTSLLSLGGTAARTIGLERNITTNTAGSALTISASGATSGMVSTVTVVAGGVGYSPSDVLTLASPSGGTASTITVATIAATGGLKTLAIVAGGTGYTPGTVVLTVVQAGGANGTISCTADAGGIITSINSVTVIGTGYSVATPLATTGGGNNDCTVNLQVINGAVATVTVTTKGALYTTGTKTTTVAPAGGTGATINVATIESATDKAGGNLLISSGISTGTGGSEIQFWTAPVGTTGATDNAVTQKMVIDKVGNVGIATTAPDAPLEVNSATGLGVRITYNDANGSAANHADWTVGSTGTTTITATGTNPDIVLTPGGSGKVKIGVNEVATLVSNVATATALAADPANCSAGQIALGITAAGVAECTATPSGLTSVGATTFTGALTGNASSATLASTVTVVDSTSATTWVGLYDTITGSLAPKTDAALTYNATTGILTATGFIAGASGVTVTKQTGVPGTNLLYEATVLETNGVGWKGPASRASDLYYQFPDADPTAGQVLVFAVPATDLGLNTTKGTWATPLISGGALGTPSSGTGTNLTGMPKLSSAVYAATTSTELAGVISDETGSGLLVYNNTPALITPALGAATATSLLATGVVDGTTYIIETATSAGYTINKTTYKSAYFFTDPVAAAATFYFTLPAAESGLQYCIGNGSAKTGILRVTAVGDDQIDLDGTLGTAAGWATATAVAGNFGCFVGVNAAKWKALPTKGTWTIAGP